MKNYTKSMIIVIILCSLIGFSAKLAIAGDLKPEDLKVKGFYLGMTRQEAMQNAMKLGWDPGGFKAGGVFSGFQICSQGPQSTLLMELSFDNNILRDMVIRPSVFGADGMLCKEFAQRFCNSYNIPAMGFYNGGYRYRNDYGLGVTIICDGIVKGVEIEKFGKTNFD